jgi:hypothetical protein
MLSLLAFMKVMSVKSKHPPVSGSFLRVGSMHEPDIENVNSQRLRSLQVPLQDESHRNRISENNCS